MRQFSERGRSSVWSAISIGQILRRIGCVKKQPIRKRNNQTSKYQATLTVESLLLLMAVTGLSDFFALMGSTFFCFS